MRRLVMLDRAWPLALCALAVSVAFASPHIVDGDSAELATLGAIGGRAHPPGYPLYVLWLRLWSWLPGASPAHTAAIATAILGAAAVACLHAACRAWGARPLSATIATAIFAAAPVVQRYHCEAEVFALNHLVVALILWLAAERGPLRGRWRGAVLGLIAGAGLANQLTCALVAPIGLYGVARAAREAGRATWALAIGGLVLGLAPYAYLAVADGPAAWGAIATPDDLLGFFLRRDFGGAGSFLTQGAGAGLANVVACFATLARSWLWLPGLAGVVVLGVRIARPAGETRWAWALLAVSFVLSGPVLASRFNLEPRGLGLYVCERFHLQPALLLAIPVAMAVDLACQRVVRVRAATAAALVGFVILSLAGFPRLDRTHSPAMERGIEHLLVPLPGAAIAVVSADDHCLGGAYVQLARGLRPDVTIVCSGLIATRWYRAKLAAGGVVVPPTTGPALADALLRTGRPVFVDRSQARILAVYPSYPFGVVLRIVPPGARIPPASELVAINRDVYATFDLGYPRPGLDDGYATEAHHRYAATWADLARRLDREGDRAAALDAFAVTRALQPE